VFTHKLGSLCYNVGKTYVGSGQGLLRGNPRGGWALCMQNSEHEYNKVHSEAREWLRSFTARGKR